MCVLISGHGGSLRSQANCTVVPTDSTASSCHFDPFFNLLRTLAIFVCLCNIWTTLTLFILFRSVEHFTVTLLQNSGLRKGGISETPRSSKKCWCEKLLQWKRWGQLQ